MTKKSNAEAKTDKGCSAYDGTCPIVHALDIIGGKWKLPVLWHLAEPGTGSKAVRYNELRRSVAGVTNMMLTKCLKELEADGLVHRVQYPEVPPRVEYSLTESGARLIPSLDTLYAWGRDMLERRKE